MTTGGTKLSQKDYLKKYLSGGADGKKKKKKKSKSSTAVLQPKVKFIDDDVDVSKLQPLDESALDLYELTEDAPQIVGIVDERPAELQALEQYKQTQRWKVLGDSDGDGIRVSESGTSQRAASVLSVEEEVEELYVRPKGQDKRTGKSRKDLDFSPPRRKRQDGDESPPRRKRQDADESPPRRRKQSDSDVSPPRKKAHNDSDASPPRKGCRYDSDESPPRAKRQSHDYSGSKHYSDSSLRKKQHKDSDVSPHKKGKCYNSDESPPRRKRQNESSISPPRRKQHYDSDTSPPRKRQSNDSHRSLPGKKSRQRESQYGSDTSPPRRPGRRNSEDREISQPKVKQGKDTLGTSEGKMRKTLDGKVAGLQNAKNLKQELQEFKQREEKVFERMDDSLSGRGAAVVQRDRKTGLKRDLEREQAEQRAKDEKENKAKEKYTRWGKGLKQTEDQQNRLQKDLYEMSKPLARYADDADLDAHYRDQDREGDPMLEYLKNKRKDEAKARVPLYQGSFPPNRYGIRPGYRWDGVDRSGGYEKKWFEAKNAKKATEEEAYKWSTSDM